MAKVHIAKQGFLTKSTLPNISRPGPATNVTLSTLVNANQTTKNVSNTEVVDSSSYGFYVSNTSGFPSQTQFTPFAAGTGGSIFFDGSGDFLQVTGTNTQLQFGTGDFTIEFWIWTSIIGSQINIIDFRAGSGPNTAPLIFISAAGAAGYYVNNAIQITGGTVTAQSWTHIAVVRISSQTKLYVQGTQVGSTYADTTNYSSGADRPTIGCGGATSIGNYTNDSNLRGFLSNVRVVKGIGVYTGNFTVPTSPLTSTQSAGTNIAAISGNETSLLLNGTNYRVIDSSTAASKGLCPASLTYAPLGGQVNFHPYSGGGTYGSYWFDGTYSYIDSPYVPDWQITGDMTVEAWIYPTTAGTARNIINQYQNGNTGNSNFAFGLTSGNKLFADFYAVGVNTITSTSNVSANVWTHVAVVRTGTAVRLYINGTLDASTLTFSGSTNLSTYPMRIGTGFLGSIPATSVNGLVNSTTVGGYNGTFPGYITGIRFVKDTAVYSGSFTPPSIQPVDVSGAASAASYPSTTNVNTSFASSDTLLLTKFDNWTIQDNDILPKPIYAVRSVTTSTAQAKFGAASLYYNTNRPNTQLYLASPATNFGTGNFTVMFWAYMQAWSAGSPNFFNTFVTAGIPNSNTSSSNVYAFVITNAGSVLINRYGIGNITFGSITPASYINTWFHVAFIRNSGTTTAYINGTSIGSSSMSGLTVGNAGGGSIGNWYVSGQYQVGELFPAGYMDDVVIASSALYTSNFTPGPTSAATDPYPSPSTITNNTYGVYQNY